MAIQKQEFYEGAALHMLVRAGFVTNIKYEPPLFTINNHVKILLKYSTKGRSPWGFTFMPTERALLQDQALHSEVVIGLICGSDGVAALSHEALRSIIVDGDTAVHVACYRRHGEHYEISGPTGSLSSKVAPSVWERLLDSRGRNEA